ncbi:hypothetical protein LTR36_003415 [Oleoguttula mirabilis]|uniref:Phosphatidylglycerol lysyltransferase C-terminal domain-containing protein n=1 Tax=Oleoguttula mirabilis TaxID=1507867 RepID=A0AAV9JJV0_9PEZI|nr:hypothetical protein LTR36_003415 [Oleoguttula mirabilis]
MSILFSSDSLALSGTSETTNGEGVTNGSSAAMSPKHEANTGKKKNTSEKPQNARDPKAPKAPKARKAPKEDNTTNEEVPEANGCEVPAGPKSPQILLNGYDGTTGPRDSQEVKESQTARPAEAKAQKLPKPPKAPEKSLHEKLGGDLADGLVKDPKLFKNSLNLVDRVSFVKLPQAAAVHALAEDEDEDEDSIDSSLIGEFQAAGEVVQKPSKEEKQRSKGYEPRGWNRQTFDLHDFTALACLQELISQYGRVSHMGILDKSYTFFITKDRTAALYYKIKTKVAVVGGDPLCPPHLFPFVLAEFEKFRKKWGLGLAFLGAGQTFVDYARTQKYTTMCFACERVLNPMTNPVLHSNAGKSITRTARILLDPKKDGLTLAVYAPALGKNAVLQQQLVNVYEAWRNARNDSGRPQAYITVYDPFALPELMTYIYTSDRDGLPNGFAALRILGAEQGYHLDPYVATPGAPKGITDLLIYGTMSLLNTARISYLSLGYEPLDDLGEIRGIPDAFRNISRKVHKRIFNGLHVAGKKDYHDKFHPDLEQQQNLYLVFPPGIPGWRHMSAVVHVANISFRKTLFKMPPIGNAMGTAMAGMFARIEKEGAEGMERGRLSVDSLRRGIGRSTSAPAAAAAEAKTKGSVEISVIAAATT